MKAQRQKGTRVPNVTCSSGIESLYYAITSIQPRFGSTRDLQTLKPVNFVKSSGWDSQEDTMGSKEHVKFNSYFVYT